MKFESTIECVKKLQAIFPKGEVKIKCPITKIKDEDIDVLKSELKVAGITGGSILRVNDIKQREYEEELEKFLSNLFYQFEE